MQCTSAFLRGDQALRYEYVQGLQYDADLGGRAKGRSSLDKLHGTLLYCNLLVSVPAKTGLGVRSWAWGRTNHITSSTGYLVRRSWSETVAVGT